MIINYLLYVFILLLIPSSIRGQDVKQQVIELNDQAWELSYTAPEKAIELSQQALLLAKQHELFLLEAESYEMLAILYDELGDFEQATAHYYAAYHLQDSLQNNAGKGNILYNLAGVYLGQKKYDKIIALTEEMMDLHQQTPFNGDFVVSTLNLMALSHKNLEQKSQAYQEFQEARDLIQTSPEGIIDIGTRLSVELNFASLLYEMDSMEVATRTTQQVYETAVQKEVLPIQVNALLLLGQINRNLKKWELAEHFLEQGRQLAEAAEQRERLRFFYEEMALLQEKMGNYKKALEFYRTFFELQSEILSEEKEKELVRMESKFKFEQQEKKVLNLSLEKEREQSLRKEQEQIVSQQRLGLLAACLGLLALYWIYQQKQKNNRLLAQKNKLIAESLKEKEMLLGEIHHRVKNNLQLVASLLDLQKNATQDAQIIQALTSTQKRVDAMAIIHKKLYEQTNFEGINMQEYIPQLASVIEESYRSDQQLILLMMDVDELLLNIQSSIPIGLLITELLTNAYKYAFQELTRGKISIRLKDQEDYLRLEVVDNGKGLEQEQLEQQASFGMRLVHSLAEQLGAKLQVKAAKGTHFIVDITKFKRYVKPT